MLCKDINPISEGKVNSGKNYKEYLCEYRKKENETKKVMMLKAQETIRELRKWREENGCIYDDLCEDFFLDEL